MHIRTLRLIPLLLLVSALFVSAVPNRANAQTGQRCFPETGFCIDGRIREFWEQNGGLAVFGFPIAAQQEEQIEGKPFQVQWFERNRLELHPENARPYDVLLGRLGADRLVQQGRDWNSFPKTGAAPGCRFFAETGHNVCGDILKAWHANGLEFDGKGGKSEAENLGLFGLPLSDAQPETIEGKSYSVQWFERGRFELHPENQPPYNVLLGLLGKEVRTSSGGGAPGTPPAATCTDVPDPVSARIRPGKCVSSGEVLAIDIFGFQPNENLGFWLTTPDGSVFGTVRTVNIGPSGRADGFPIDTIGLPEGMWNIVFQGTSSQHQSIAYFKILSPSPPASCPDVPDPVSARIRPGKCVNSGEVLAIDIFGFQSNEDLGFWLTAPDGSVFGTVRTVNIGPSGMAEGFPIDTLGLPAGMWNIVFQGTSSQHQSIAYFKISKP